MKGIETQGNSEDTTSNTLSLDTLSRLKGIETVSIFLSSVLFNDATLDTLSRLKGMFLVVSCQFGFSAKNLSVVS